MAGGRRGVMLSNGRPQLARFRPGGLPTFPTRNTHTQSGNWPRAEALPREVIEQPLLTVPAPRRFPAFLASERSLRVPARGRRARRRGVGSIDRAWQVQAR